jgi:hypothetical protein
MDIALVNRINLLLSWEKSYDEILSLHLIDREFLANGMATPADSESMLRLVSGGTTSASFWK